MAEVLEQVRGILETRLFDIGGTPVTVATLLTVSVILLATVLVSRTVRVAVTRVLERTRAGSRAVGTITGLLHYILLLVGFGVAIQTVGIDLSALFAAGALFAVALGFAMQSITQNFVAGVILLSERAIRPGDVLEVEGKLVRITDMGIRSLTAESRDGENLIIPNSVLIQTTVKNYTLFSSALRVRVPVGVTYRSDMKQVRETLTEVAEEMNRKWGVASKRPLVAMTGFGDNSVNWVIAVWMNEPWELVPRVSELHEAVWWAFHERGIVIAFPQLDVHLDEEVTAGLAARRDDVA